MAFSQLSVRSDGFLVNSSGTVVHLRGLNTAGLEFGDGVGSFTQARINAFASLFDMNLWRLCVNVSWWNNNVLMTDGVTHYRDWIQTIIGWMKAAGCYVEIDPTNWATIGPSTGTSCNTPPVITSATDTFTRADGSGWGTSSDGKTWSSVGGTATRTISSNEGKLTTLGSNIEVMQLGSTSYADQSVLVRVAVTSSTAGEGGAALRINGNTNWYAALFDAENLYLIKMVGGVQTNIATVTKAFTSGAYYWIRMYTVGTQITIRTWADGTSEPDPYDIQVTDSSLASGGYGLIAWSMTNADQILFDHFTVTTPQTSCRISQNTQTFPPWTEDQITAAFVSFFQSFVPLYVNDPSILYDAMNEPSYFGGPATVADNNTVINAIRALHPTSLIFFYSFGDSSFDGYSQANLVYDSHVYDDISSPWQDRLAYWTTPGLIPTTVATTIGEWNVNTTNDPAGFATAIANVAIDRGVANTYYNADNLLLSDNSTLTAQGILVQDAFQTIATFESSPGTIPGWTWDTDHSRLIAQGTSGALYVRSISCANVEALLIIDRAETLQIILRSSASGHYDLQLNDDSASGGSTLDFVKYTAAGGSVVLRSEHSKTIPRGQYHTIRVTLIGGNYTVWLNGVQVYAGIDPSPLVGNGSCGLWFNAGTSYIRDLAIRPLGQDATGVNAYTRVRLSSTDPLTSPKVTDLVACVRSPQIATGVIIPQTKDWAGKQTVAGALDEIAKESNMSWRFNESFQLVMQPRDGQIAPFVLATVNGNIDAVSPPKVVHQSPAYRNRQTITGAVELVEQPESKLGNGVDTSWSLTYPIESIESIQINEQSQTFGIKDTDTNRLFYYIPGEKTLSLDSAQVPPTSRIDITYIARKPYEAVADDKAQQAVLALLEGASGIYEASEDIGGLSSAAADTLAQARLTENGRLAINWSATTLQSGLGPGQLLTVIVPEHDLNDLQFLITSVSTQIRMQGDSTLFYWYDIEATTGPSLGSWSRALTSRLLQKG